jgi:acyl transferase domain-containing protein
MYQQRWNMDALFDADPDAPGKIYTRALGIVQDPELFDAAFFGIAPREAEDIDPQHRVLLEVCHDALQRAGYSLAAVNGTSTGVFVGISGQDYAHLGSRLGHPESITPWQGTGNAFSAAAGRISYLLNLNGPSLAVDTACSSSLVALHLACQSLRNREWPWRVACI